MRTFKRLLVAVLLLVLCLLVVFVAAGLTIPSERSFTNEIAIDVPADEVWDVIMDKDRYAEWQTQLERVEVIDSHNWLEYPKGAPDALRFRLVKDERPTSMEFHYTMGDNFSGHWKGEISSTATGVRLKTTDSYRAAGWPTKIMIYTFFDMESFAKDWNSKLKQRAEKLK